jgi:hypothetical protein
MDINSLGASLSKIKESLSHTAAAPFKAAPTQPLDPKVFMSRDEAQMKDAALDKINRFAAALADSPLDNMNENTDETPTGKVLHYFDGLYRGDELKQKFLELPPEKQAKFCSDFEASQNPDLKDPEHIAVQRVSMCFDLLNAEPPKLSAREAATLEYFKGFREGEAIKQRFLMMPEAQREQVCNVLANLDEIAKVQFTSVLAKEKPWETKGQGTPELFGILAGLDHIAQGELCPKLKQLGMEKQAMMGTLVHQLCFEGAVFQGKDTDTCSAASLQANLVNTDPGEYARIAAGIMVDGEVRIHGDETLSLSTSETGKEDGGRSGFDEVMQGTFVSFGKKFEAVGNDYFSGRGGRGGSFRGKAGQGLTSNQILNMNQFISGVPSTIVVVTPENRQKVIQAMEEATKAGYNVTIGKDGHALDVTKVSKHPKWGDFIEYNDSLSGGGGNSPADSFGDIEVVILPAKFAGGFQRSDLINHSDFGGRGGSGGTGR